MITLTNNFKTTIAKKFVETVAEENDYFLAAHKSVPYDNDALPPEVGQSTYQTHYELYKDLIFGKHIAANDVAYMVRRSDWVAGKVYAMYDDKDSDLHLKDFYCSVGESGSYYYFKCLDNNHGRPSVDKPVRSEVDYTDEIYTTSDGYQWKLVGMSSGANWNKFATSEYTPLYPIAEVVANAKDGEIATIIVDTAGQAYNSYASGRVKQSAYAGNNLFYSLNSEKFSDYIVTVPATHLFVEEKVFADNPTGPDSTGVIINVTSSNATHNDLRITNTSGTFKLGQPIRGAQSNANTTISKVIRLTESLSANTDFYKNNSFYIRDGVGAGQLRTITEYVVTGSERIVMLDKPLSPMPDATSVFEITPRVQIAGDGSGAQAIAVVNPSSNSIAGVEIIRSGSGYSHAEIQIFANTGYVSLSNNAITTTSASARAIISPPSGHGYDIQEELFANRVCISQAFANTESNSIPIENDYRKVSILKGPAFANAEFTMTNTVLYEAGEVVEQATTKAKGTVSNREGNTLRLTNVTGFFSTTGNVVGKTSAQVNTIASLGTKNYKTFDQREIYQMTMTPGPVTGQTLQKDERVVQEGLRDIEDTSIALTIDQSAYSFNEGEGITQATTLAKGVITNRAANTIWVKVTEGFFIGGLNITGNENSFVAQVTDVDNTTMANAVGNVFHAAGNVLSLTDVRGVFSVSDGTGGINTLVGQTSGSTATLTGRDFSRNYLVPGSGRFLYVENFAPIQRAADQSERIKIVIEF